jgi:hypothetical protein
MTVRRILVLFAAGVIAATATSASANPVAKVWIADQSPLVVRGSGFHASSKVTVTVAKAKHLYKTTATSTVSGGFTARFASTLTRQCGNTLVSARDASGVLAVSTTVTNDCGGVRVPPPR